MSGMPEMGRIEYLTRHNIGADQEHKGKVPDGTKATHHFRKYGQLAGAMGRATGEADDSYRRLHLLHTRVSRMRSFLAQVQHF